MSRRTQSAPAWARHPERAWLPVAAAMMAVAWGGNEFTPLLVMYRDVSGFTEFTVYGLLAAYVVGIVPALLIGGPLSTAWGRRMVMLPAAPVSFLGSTVLALSPDSAPLLAVGRVLCGAALGMVMAVGSTWVKELCDRAGTDPTAGARRAALSLTGGFLLGAGVAAALAQWAPGPTYLAYVVHLVLTVAAGCWLFTVPETRPRRSELSGRQLVRLFAIPSARHPRFLLVVVPAAPWVFSCAGAAYAVLPMFLSDAAGDLPIAFSGMMTVVTLGCGVGIQTLGRRIDTPRSSRATVVGLSIAATGTLLGAGAASTHQLALGLVAAAVLGAGYGLTLVAGLSEVQRIATPDDLAGLTAVYYSLTYLGFFVPMVLAALSAYLSYAVLFAIGTGIALACLIIVACAWRAFLPPAAPLEEYPN
ncbi:MFS transporter [Citricoccus sp. NR2]|uniref:MFS transporter n=1 Tax=Citricoccus sp. NR2 TaxID=3004095 RepID=UPI0022DD3852|nr:MFS transporter [Citricoccus sp. NR2]WBL19141.1 MFS transporter [Citricoccus sp. NR2]